VALTLATTGVWAAAGRLDCTSDTALRTSLAAVSGSVPSVNSTVVTEEPSLIEVETSSTPSRVATAFSTTRATCTSISLGAAPGCATVTVTVGRSMSGMLLVRSCMKP
jgi:hypothetical protein